MEGKEVMNEQDQKRNSARLQQLWINESLEMLSELPWWVVRSTATTLVHLHIEDLPRFTTLPEWLQNLTSCKTLEIFKCPELLSPPEGMRYLTALQELKI